MIPKRSDLGFLDLTTSVKRFKSFHVTFGESFLLLEFEGFVYSFLDPLLTFYLTYDSFSHEGSIRLLIGREGEVEWIQQSHFQFL